jgi:hypothetical protein
MFICGVTWEGMMEMIERAAGDHGLVKPYRFSAQQAEAAH